jgi:diacylglycerol kinase family enzyme
MRLVADERTLPDACWAFVLNVPRYAMNLSFVDEADPQDGRLDLCTFQQGSFLRGLYYFFSVVFRQHRKIRESRVIRFRRLTIESDEYVPYELDGDPGGSLPLTIEVAPQRLCVMVSDDWIAENRRESQ